MVSGSKGIWKEKVVEDWWEQVGEKSSMHGWCGRVKEEDYVEVLDMVMPCG